MALIFAIIALGCLITFFVAIFRNIIVNKNITGWLMPEGTTKTEKIIIGFSFLSTLLFAVIGAVAGRF